MSRAAKGIIVVASIVFVVLALLSIFRLHFVFWIYTDIANWLSINLNLDNTVSTVVAITLTAALVPVIPYFLWYFVLGRHAMEVFIITASVAVVVALLLYKFGQDVYFHPRTGEPIRYYASTPTGVVFSRSPGYDKKFRTEFKPVIPEIIASLENQKAGITPKKLEFDIHGDDLNGIEFFSTVDGSPKVFFYEAPDGSIELFNSAGIHPQYQEPLKAITPEAIARLKGSFKAVQAAAMENAKVVEHYLIKDDIVMDKATSLMWLRCSVGQKWDGQTCIGSVNTYTYDQGQPLRIARELAHKYRWGGYSDWRLPTVQELMTLVKLEQKPTTINTEVFPNTSPIRYWSASIEDNLLSRDDWWTVDFSNGDEEASFYLGTCAVRLARKWR